MIARACLGRAALGIRAPTSAGRPCHMPRVQRLARPRATCKMSSPRSRSSRMNRTARVFTCLLFAAGLLLSPLARAEGKKIILIAGTPSHEFGGHEHNAGVLLLAKFLKESQLAHQLDVV